MSCLGDTVAPCSWKGLGRDLGTTWQRWGWGAQEETGSCAGPFCPQKLEDQRIYGKFCICVNWVEFHVEKRPCSLGAKVYVELFCFRWFVAYKKQFLFNFWLSFYIEKCKKNWKGFKIYLTVVYFWVCSQWPFPCSFPVHGTCLRASSVLGSWHKGK